MNFTKIKIPSRNGICCSVVKSCLTQRSHGLKRQGSPVLYYLPEFSQIHVHWLCDAIQTSPPLSPPSPLALNLAQHQGLLQ